MTNKQLADLPEWLFDLLVEPANQNKPPLDFMVTGSRNHSLASLAGFYRHRFGLTGDELEHQLQIINSQQEDPLCGAEVASIARSISNYEDLSNINLDDLPLSRWVAAQISPYVSYAAEVGWLSYADGRWVEDPKGLSVAARIKSQFEIIVEALKAKGDAERLKQISVLQRNQKLNAVLAMIASDEKIFCTLDDFDADANLLNLKNGTLELETQTFRKHRPGDLLTKQADVTFDPNADCPRFKDFVSRIIPESHAKFALRLLGYTISGKPKEQVFGIFYGSGANGKSTLVNAVSDLLNDYSVSVEPSSLMKQKMEKVRSDLARLKGANLAVTSELAMGEILDAALMKRFTGGERITARKLYQNEISFVPRATFIMTTNNLPVIDGSDQALARRLILLPFDVKIPEHERDHNLEATLAQERSGILNLLLEGLNDYQKNGLSIPEDLKQETEKYVEASDLIGCFLRDVAEFGDGCTIGAKDLFNQYWCWCAENSVKPLSRPNFKRSLEKKGYTQKRSNAGFQWVGMRRRRH